jgi:ornithine cyclodeaminase/alanine dehydrogenase-like protein (mu-crystallin family)
MALLLNNKDLESVLGMPACIDALYQGLKAYVCGDAARRPRIDLFAPTSRPNEFACFSSVEGIIKNRYYAIRLKPEVISWPEINGRRRRVTYTHRPGFNGGLILLFSAENGELLAIMNDDHVQHMRVGATAALGAKYLAVPDAEVVGILGSGGMARAFALGFAAVRRLTKIKVYSPNPQHLRVYCREMNRKLTIEVAPMKSPREAVQGSDIVAACTNSRVPVLEGDWLEPGMYVANVSGGELDQEALRRITLVGYLTFEKNPLRISGFSDYNFEAGNSMAYLAGQPEERKGIPTDRRSRQKTLKAKWVACVDWKTETLVGRTSEEEITLLAELSAGSLPGETASSGIQGIQIASIAGRAYELASAQGLGKPISTDLFLQKGSG